jgi:hypothetical protein
LGRRCNVFSYKESCYVHKASFTASAQQIDFENLTHINLRYLTKITDQILALVSTEHAQALDLDKFATYDKASEEPEEDHSLDRMFSFSVAKTNEQSEAVKACPGFEVNTCAVPVLVTFLMCSVFKLSHQQLGMAERQSQCPTEYWSSLQPTLVAGETKQAFLVVDYEGETSRVQSMRRTMTDIGLESLIR